MEKVEIHFLTTGNMVQIVLVMAVVIVMRKTMAIRGGGSSGGSSGDNSGCLIVVALIVASIVAYSISEILGTILLIVLVIGILCTR